MRRMGEIMMKQPGVENAVGFPGLSINGFTNSSNSGIVFAALKNFDERKSTELERRRDRRAAQQAVRRASRTRSSSSSRRRRCRGSARPAASSCTSRTAPRSATRRSTRRPRRSWRRRTRRPSSRACSRAYQVNVPQLYADIDRTKARQLGVPVTEVFDTMQIYLGSLYVNDFNKFGRTYSVRVQADAPYRARAEDIGLLKVRSNTRRDGAALGADERAPGRGPRARDALQRLPRRRHQRPRRARLLLGPGAGRDRAHRRRDAAAGHRLRVDRDHLPGDPRRQLGDLGLSARDLPRVPGARRALREPGAADRDHPDRADQPAAPR